MSSRRWAAHSGLGQVLGDLVEDRSERGLVLADVIRGEAGQLVGTKKSGGRSVCSLGRNQTVAIRMSCGRLRRALRASLSMTACALEPVENTSSTMSRECDERTFSSR